MANVATLDSHVLSSFSVAKQGLRRARYVTLKWTWLWRISRVAQEKLLLGATEG